MKLLRYVMLLGIAALFHNGFAAVSAPKFEKDFNNLISNSKLAVVHFVDYDFLPVGKEHAADVHDLMGKLEDLEDVFSDISREADFAGIKFIGVDLKALPHMVDEYDIKDFSTFMLFKDSRPFKQRREVVKHAGMMSQIDLEDWIEEYFGEFKTSVQNKKPASRVVRYTSYQPSYSTHYYSRPYRRGYYRPYYRRYGGYGPGFGFGIGGRRGGIGFGLGW